jgi:hypothetical protein
MKGILTSFANSHDCNPSGEVKKNCPRTVEENLEHILNASRSTEPIVAWLVDNKKRVGEVLPTALDDGFKDILRSSRPSGLKWNKVEGEREGFLTQHGYPYGDSTGPKIAKKIMDGFKTKINISPESESVSFTSKEWKKLFMTNGIMSFLTTSQRPPDLHLLHKIEVDGNIFTPDDDCPSQSDRICGVITALRRSRVDKKLLWGCMGLVVTLVVFSLHLYSDRQDWYWRSRNYCYMSVIAVKCIMLILLLGLTHDKNNALVYRLMTFIVALASGINAFFSYAEVRFGKMKNKAFDLTQTSPGSKWKKVDEAPVGIRLDNRPLALSLASGKDTFTTKEHEDFGVDVLYDQHYVVTPEGEYYSQDYNVIKVQTIDIRTVFVVLALLDVVLALKAIFSSERCRPGSLRLFDLSI